MNAQDIKQLLERYYQGATNQEEERRLKEYFAHDDVPKEWEAEREMFRFFSRQARQDIPLPQGLEERIGQHIDRLAKAAAAGGDKEPARILRASGSTGRRLTGTVLLRWTAGIAASLALAVGIGLYLQNADRPRDTFDNPELAYAEARRAFDLFGAAFDKGEQHVEKAENTVQTVQAKLSKYRLFMKTR